MAFNVTKFKKLKLKDYKINERISNYTTFKIGGSAYAVVNITSIKEIKKVVKFCNKFGLKYFVLGAGSNVLFCDSGFSGIIMRFQDGFSKLKLIKNHEKQAVLNVQSGHHLTKLNKFCAKNGFGGLEWSFGIPASVGGATCSNIGSFNFEFKDYVKSVTVLIPIKIFNFTLFLKRTLKNKKCNFVYRDSIFKHKKYIILSTTLVLNKKEPENVLDNMQKYFNIKKETQPLGSKNAGCIFKNGENYKIAKVINDLSLKGKTIGKAQISTKHCGFIVNKSNATCQNVKDLIEYIKNEVLKHNGFTPNLEIEIVEN